MNDFYFLDPSWTEPGRIRKEREKAQKIRKSQWWKTRIQSGKCHYCEGTFPKKDLTMDHVVPLARGGVSTRGNLVPSCLNCNQKKSSKRLQRF